MTTSLFFFIVLISLLNLGLGYVLALYQEHGPTFELWGLGMSRLRPVPVGAASHRDHVATLPDPRNIAGSAPSVVPVEVSDERPVDKTVETAESSAESSADAGAYQDAVARSREDAQQHCERLTTLNQQVRDIQATPNRAELDQCTSDVKDLNQRYLDRQQENLQQACEEVPQGETFEAIDGMLRDACGAHAAEIEDSLATLDGTELTEDNLEDYCRRLLDETDRHIESSGEYRDALDNALGGMEAEQDRGESSAGNPERPAVVSTVEAAVAKILTRWREDTAMQEQSLTAALIDVDDYAEIVNRNGSLAGDRAVSAVRDVVATAQKEGGELSHNSGQLFLLAYPGTSVQWAGASLERVRQIVEKTRFHHDGATVPVTISTAAVEAQADDTAEALCERLLTTVREAQTGGNNRTFLHEGTRPTSMAPTKLDIPENTLEL